MVKIGIIGHGSDKFTEYGKQLAQIKIQEILKNKQDGDVFISGHSPVGGIDIWSEDIARELGYTLEIKSPKQQIWDAEYGYKQRNIDIAKSSDVIHIILVKEYPKEYKGMKFNYCYHCDSKDHIKSGACWTGKQAINFKKNVIYHYIDNYKKE